MKNKYIEEVMVYGTIDKRTGDTIVRADIYPDYAAINEELGEMSEEGLKDFMKAVIDETNEEMPLYKRVKRFRDQRRRI